MSISAASILVDGTVAVTNGTATTFITKGDADNKHSVILDDGSAFSALSGVVFTSKDPKVSVPAPNGYTQKRNTVLYSVPLALDNGARTVNTVKVEMATDIELTDAERDSMRIFVAQLVMDSDYDDFWNKQSMA